jgi:phosphohistidine phosphatase
LASSPLVRAKQTAEILRQAYGAELKVTEIAALEPAKPVNAVLHWLQGQPAEATVALVGHEPQLGMLVSWLLSGDQRVFTPLRKGSACLLEFQKEIKAGGATLVWMLKPSHLRGLSSDAKSKR